MAQKNPCQGKQGIWFAQVVNSLILKVKFISIFAANISIFLSWISLRSQFCVCNSHKRQKEICGWIGNKQGKRREFENAI